MFFRKTGVITDSTRRLGVTCALPAMLLMAMSQPTFANELDNEIDSLQVQISHRQQSRSIKPVEAPLGSKTPAGTKLPTLDRLTPEPAHDNSADFEALDNTSNVAQAPAQDSEPSQTQVAPEKFAPAPSARAKTSASANKVHKSSHSRVAQHKEIKKKSATKLAAAAPAPRPAPAVVAQNKTTDNPFDASNVPLPKSEDHYLAPEKNAVAEHTHEPARTEPVAFVADDSAPNTAALRTRINTPVHKDRPNNGLFQRVTLLPMAALTTVDGDDRGNNNIMPTGNGATDSGYYGFAASGALLGDFNVFGSREWVIEAGAEYFQAGSNMGVAPYGQSGYIFNDAVKLTYAAVPVSMKWIPAGEGRSGLYAKAGVMPAFLVGHSYSYTGYYSNEYRFGGYSSYDIMATAGLGFAFNLARHYQIVVDVSGFQGFVPIFQTYSVLNVGGMAGVGLSYIL